MTSLLQSQSLTVPSAFKLNKVSFKNVRSPCCQWCHPCEVNQLRSGVFPFLECWTTCTVWVGSWLL